MTQGRKGHVRLREENPQRKAREPSCLKGKSRSSSPPDASERRLAGTGGCEPQPAVGGAAGERCEGALAAAVGRQRPELGWEPATLGCPSASSGHLPAAAGSAAPRCQYLLRARRGGRAESSAAEPQLQPQPPAGRTPAPPPSPRGHRSPASPRAMAPGNSSRNFSAPEARNGSGEKGGKGGRGPGDGVPGMGSRGGCPASHLSEARSLQHRREDSSGPRPPAPPGPAASGPRRQGGEAGARPASGEGRQQGRTSREGSREHPPAASCSLCSGRWWRGGQGGPEGYKVVEVPPGRWLQGDFCVLSPHVSYRTLK